MKQIIIILVVSLILMACSGEKPQIGICYTDIYEHYAYRAANLSEPYTWDEREQIWITRFGIKSNLAGPDTLSHGFHMETEDDRETMMRLNAYPFDTLSHANIKYVYDGRVPSRNGKLPVISKTGETVIRYYSSCVFLAPS
jgi:hypothetical protein